jgi:hypothetical protein
MLQKVNLRYALNLNGFAAGSFQYAGLQLTPALQQVLLGKRVVSVYWSL